MEIIRKKSSQKILGAILALSILAAIVFLSDFFVFSKKTQAGYPWTLDLREVSGICVVDMLGREIYGLNTGIKAGTQSYGLASNDEGARIVDDSSDWFNKGGGDPLIAGLNFVARVVARNAVLSEFGGWTCPPECVSWGTCYGVDEWGSPYSYSCCTSYYNGEISAMLYAAGTRNSPDEPNLAPGYGAAGYPYYANIGVTTGSISVSPSLHTTFNWSTSGSGQEAYKLVVWKAGWESGELSGGGEKSRIVALPSEGTYNWKVAACGAISGQSCAWTGWASDSFATQYTISVSKAGTGSGSVKSVPGGINCGGDCSEGYNAGTSITLTATPDASSIFTGWSGGGCSGTGTCSVTMDATKSVTATFTLNLYALSVSKSGNGSGTITSSPAGINCGSTCSASYTYGTSVTLSAPASAGSVFTGWSGSGCSGIGTCTVTMDATKSVTATFQLLPTLDIKADSSDGPITIAFKASATLSWTSANTVACTASNGWSGSKPTSGSESTGSLTSSKTYTLTCTGPGGSASDSVTVNVTPNNPPSVTNLQVVQPDYRVAGPGAIFSWTFSDPDAGDTQGAYQVQVATNPGFSGPGIVIDSGKVSSASNSYATSQGVLSYNTTYYWRVRVWDNYDNGSAWATGSSFTTPKHQYPTVDFSWVPLNPSVGEIIQFADQSVVFGGATKQSWSWVIPDAIYLAGTNSSSQNPQVKFSSAGSKNVSLTVTDSDGYSNTKAVALTSRLPLPGWKETAPQ